jgi:hypothetical protein
MNKPIHWKNWLFVSVLSLLFLGNVAGGKPLVYPDSAEAIGYDAFSVAVWGLFLWSLSPFVRNVISKIRK